MDESSLSFRETKTNVGIFLGLAILFVIFLSVFVFSQQSLRLDEAQSLWQTSHSPLLILKIVAQDVHVPLYHMILHGWQVFFGSSAAAGRSLSLIFFILIIPMTYFLGKISYNRRVGIFGALLVAISPFFNWYGNEIRMYSLFTFVTIVNQYLFVQIYKGKGNKSFIWLWYAISVVIGMYTHYFFGFVLLSQALFFMMYRELFSKNALKRFLLVLLLVVVFFGPWVAYVVHMGGMGSSSPLLVKPTTIDLFNTFSEFLFGFQNDHLNTMLVSLWPISVLLVLLSLRRNQKIEPQTMYFMLSFLIPIGIVFVISVAYRPIFVTRYLILTLPSLYLVISSIFSSYPRRLALFTKAGFVLVMLVFLGIEASSATTPVKENYRDATAYLEANASARDIIAVSAPFTIYPVEYYYRGPAELSTLPIWNRLASGPMPPYDEEKLPEQIALLKGSHQTLWLLQSYDQGYEEKLRVYLDTHFERTSALKFSKGLHLYSYKLRYD